MGQPFEKVKGGFIHSVRNQVLDEYDSVFEFTFFADITHRFGPQPECEPDIVSYFIYSKNGSLYYQKSDCNGPYDEEELGYDGAWEYLTKYKKQIFDPDFKTLFASHAFYYSIVIHTKTDLNHVTLNFRQFKKNSAEPKNPKAEKLIKKLKRKLKD